jgi:hypothetical protein
VSTVSEPGPKTLDTVIAPAAFCRRILDFPRRYLAGWLP